ncbi:unnamed protein product [Allacma fusca]|uniref:Uncharacterized protein n=1 Tax=Allacma fusca TaxID=39272 RepID=A0A8J2JXF5_9HEXA|nr:unnamed protein product [Allacma fusca]
MKAKKVSEEATESLYVKSLNKRVKSKNDYERLFKALCSTGNEHIAKTILEELSTQILNPSSSPAPRSSVNAINSRAIAGMRSNNSQETPCSSDVNVPFLDNSIPRSFVIEEQGQPNGRRNIIYGTTTFAVVLLVAVFVVVMVSITRTSNTQNGQPNSNVFDPTGIITHSQPEHDITFRQTERSTSRDQITSPG